MRANLTGAQPAAAARAFLAPPELPWSARPPPGVLQAPAPGLTGVIHRPGCGPNLGGAGSVLRDQVRMGSSNLRPRGEYFLLLHVIHFPSPSPRSSRARLRASVSATRIVCVHCRARSRSLGLPAAAELGPWVGAFKRPQGSTDCLGIAVIQGCISFKYSRRPCT